MMTGNLNTMEKFKIDWKYIRKSVVIAAICLSVSIALLGTSYAFILNAKTLYLQQKNLSDAMAEEGQILKEDIRLAREYSNPFNAIVNKGVVGQERRLDWVEALRESTASLKLNRSNYRIEPRQEVTPDYIENMGSFILHASRMNLQLSLLHEGDLLAVIDDMGRQASGLFHVQSCDLERKQDDFLMGDVGDNLSAECQLVWYTLDDVAAKEGGEE
jgi:hypothetical protein